MQVWRLLWERICQLSQFTPLPEFQAPWVLATLAWMESNSPILPTLPQYLHAYCSFCLVTWRALLADSQPSAPRPAGLVFWVRSLTQDWQIINVVLYLPTWS